MKIFRLLKRKCNTVINKPGSIIIRFLVKFSFLFNDDFYLKALYRFEMGKKLNLTNPITYNEKLQLYLL